MMDERQEAIARRAVACKAWRWISGMLGWSHDADSPCVRCLGKDALGYDLWWDVEASEMLIGDPTDLLPDLTDPATLGCLLALVREAWGGTAYHVRPDGLHWRVWAFEPGARVYATEAEALVAALEAAP